MTDAAYRAWLQTLPSCISGRYAEYLENGDRRNPACHVRRAGEAGTAYKPLFSAVPLTHIEHDVQTRLGELACLMEFLPAIQAAQMFHGLCRDDAVRKAKGWFDLRAGEYLERWMSETPEGRKWAQEQRTEVTA
jgi:hypothetical protein